MRIQKPRSNQNGNATLMVLMAMAVLGVTMQLSGQGMSVEERFALTQARGINARNAIAKQVEGYISSPGAYRSSLLNQGASENSGLKDCLLSADFSKCQADGVQSYQTNFYSIQQGSSILRGGMASAPARYDIRGNLCPAGASASEACPFEVRTSFVAQCDVGAALPCEAKHFRANYEVKIAENLKLTFNLMPLKGAASVVDKRDILPRPEGTSAVLNLVTLLRTVMATDESLTVSAKAILTKLKKLGVVNPAIAQAFDDAGVSPSAAYEITSRLLANGQAYVNVEMISAVAEVWQQDWWIGSAILESGAQTAEQVYDIMDAIQNLPYETKMFVAMGGVTDVNLAATLSDVMLQSGVGVSGCWACAQAIAVTRLTDVARASALNRMLDTVEVPYQPAVNALYASNITNPAQGMAFVSSHVDDPAFARYISTTEITDSTIMAGLARGISDRGVYPSAATANAISQSIAAASQMITPDWSGIFNAAYLELSTVDAVKNMWEESARQSAAYDAWVASQGTTSSSSSGTTQTTQSSSTTTSTDSSNVNTSSGLANAGLVQTCSSNCGLVNSL